jgi:hypothetical protein
MVWARAVCDGRTPSTTLVGCMRAVLVRRLHALAVARACTLQGQRQYPPIATWL